MIISEILQGIMEELHIARFKCPCVEISGTWHQLGRWPLMEYWALRRTLMQFGVRHEALSPLILWLYYEKLNLPLVDAKDLELIVRSLAPQKFTPELVGDIYTEEITKVLNAEAVR